MNTTEFYRVLEDTLELDAGRLKGNETLADLETWDSMAPLLLISMADQKFGIPLPVKAIQECKSIQDIVKLFGEQITP